MIKAWSDHIEAPRLSPLFYLSRGGRGCADNSDEHRPETDGDEKDRDFPQMSGRSASMVMGSSERWGAMPDWVGEWVPVVQLLLNAGALIGGSVIWKLYVANLKAVSAVKDATIETVEKSRDYWREKAEELERRSPEVVEKSLAERIQIRDAEITRFKADQEFDKIALRTLEIDKAQLEQDLFRTQGFRAMLALEDGYEDNDEPRDDVEPFVEEPPKGIEVVYIGEVGVDSGQLRVTDPCYIDQEWKREQFMILRDQEPTDDTVYSYSYNGACNATLNGGGHGQLGYAMGHAGAGVAFQTAWGDGGYAVYAEKHDGRIVRVYVNVG